MNKSSLGSLKFGERILYNCHTEQIALLEFSKEGSQKQGFRFWLKAYGNGASESKHITFHYLLLMSPPISVLITLVLMMKGFDFRFYMSSL